VSESGVKRGKAVKKSGVSGEEKWGSEGSPDDIVSARNGVIITGGGTSVYPPPLGIDQSSVFLLGSPFPNSLILCIFLGKMIICLFVLMKLIANIVVARGKLLICLL